MCQERCQAESVATGDKGWKLIQCLHLFNPSPVKVAGWCLNMCLALIAFQTQAMSELNLWRWTVRPLAPRRNECYRTRLGNAQESVDRSYMCTPLCECLFVFVHRPKDGVHPPAASLDPQLPPGGAEVNVSAGGLGQDVSATLRQQEVVSSAPPTLTPSVHTDRGWAQCFIPPSPPGWYNTLQEREYIWVHFIQSVNTTCGHRIKTRHRYTVSCVFRKPSLTMAD